MSNILVTPLAWPRRQRGGASARGAPRDLRRL